MLKKPQQQNQEYQIKPKPREKFKSSKCRELIQEILQQKLKTGSYQDVTTQSKDIAENIKNRLKQQYTVTSRYKFIVHVLIGQQRGQGVRVGSKCFWDYDTDMCVSETFINDSLFCLVTVYAVYLY
ncbi:unnamed protein product [Paramecium primaurelia]|uniref:Dynein light chain n=5 Tax=Paramecium TaxID=5884 RepID=A0DBP3_PARTE|nr:uncharacterized protein GSPATT00015357001 [Paramecium tetraurelia]CAD8061644.1 unnamed protein product [Paramecium primaurelia]CAD8080072.1 unnamed protein product [Paramecium sonneborni]CAD8160233.1 unnamed protein product [Paramecium octaurelia]CAD8161601.1 unnamed protein product [Paramecium pentaurelia]CAD8075107.1 unnamed protein product [Paramecium primaurelia]|eukprot:XP_001447857.1 hypothetical protein (macronuclear) [Paramecium tetraurelia strain d4-2]